MDSTLMHEEGHRLASLAKVLKDNSMPQETINMCLAARCGLPMQKIDPKSPCFVWVGDEAGTDMTEIYRKAFKGVKSLSTEGVERPMTASTTSIVGGSDADAQIVRREILSQDILEDTKHFAWDDLLAALIEVLRVRGEQYGYRVYTGNRVAEGCEGGAAHAED